jgi:hypothetical protein
MPGGKNAGFLALPAGAALGRQAQGPARPRRELQRRDPAAGGGRTHVTERVLTRKPRPSFYSSLGECAIFNAARLDRRVERRVCIPGPPINAAWKCSHAQATATGDLPASAIAP